MAALKIKGNSLLSVLDFLEQKGGSGTRQAVLALLSEETRASLRAVLASNWYPVATLCELLEAGRTHTGDARFIRDSGRHNAKFGTAGVYQSVLRSGDPAGTLDWSARMWRVFCDEGSATVERVGGFEAILKVESFPAPAALRERLLGFYAGLVELSGGKRVQAEALAAPEPDRFFLRIRWSG